MDVEIVTLSSDEEMESVAEISKSSNPVTKTSALTTETDHSLNSSTKEMEGTAEVQECETHRVKDVEPVDNSEKSSDKVDSDATEEGDIVENHSKTNNVDADKNPTCENRNNLDDKITTEVMPNLDNSSNPSKPLGEIQTSVTTSEIPQESECNDDDDDDDEMNQTLDKSCSIYSDLMDYCAFLRDNPKHREEMIKSVIKLISVEDLDPVLRQEFRIFIYRLRNIDRKKNMYLVVKSIGELLRTETGGENQGKDNDDEESKIENERNNELSSIENMTNNEKANILRQQKRLYKIQKIMKKLNQMGYIIRQLERQEVDLNDEENSAYLKLQRFRGRFWFVYRKLCEITHDTTLHRVFNDRINFAETERPQLYGRIEKWLNETKTFPDFTDILKILERDREELKLPAEEDAFRVFAVEVFQKVGNLLQTKRKYDLWNSLCGFLENMEDPASKNPDLEEVFRQNYQERVKKEEEIYGRFAEREKAEQLEPELVTDEDVYLSPESGQEEEEEILEYECDLARSLTTEFEVNYTDDEKSTSDYLTDETEDVSSSDKGSKNNFKNCKSLKWRPDKEGTLNSEDNSSTETETEEKIPEPVRNTAAEELTLVNGDNQKDIENAPTDPQPISSVRTSLSSQKRFRSLFDAENSDGKKRKSLEDKMGCAGGEGGVKECGQTAVYDVRHCRIVTNYNFKERRKVFRDLTNVTRLMKKAGLRNKMSACHGPVFLYGRYLPGKEGSWKERFRMNVRETKPKNQKCGLSEEEKTSDKSRDSDDREGKNNGENGQEGAADYSAQGNGQGEEFNSQGNGQEEDNNDKGDENRRNGKVDDETEDHEEDDDEEKEDETTEHSSNTQKTERENEDSPNENETTNANHTLSVENNETDTEKDDAVEESKEAELDDRYGSLEKCEYFYDDPGRDAAGNKPEDVEEFENLKNSLEPICVLKEEDTCDDVIEKVNNEELANVHRKPKRENAWKHGRKSREEKLKIGSSARKRPESSRGESHNQKRLPVTVGWTVPPETSQPKPRKMSASDEERVKRFLMHSPSSISITPPRKLTLSKPPSQSALQALATLRNLKGISATIVKGKPKPEDNASPTGSQSKRPAKTDQSCPTPAKKRVSTSFPVISSVQSVTTTLTPKIVTVQGNVSGFETLWPEMRNHGHATPSPIKISKVWGSSPETTTTTPQGNPSSYPGCSSRKSNPTSTQVRKKNAKKPVEYVVLD